MLETIINPIEKTFDDLKFGVKKKFNLFDPIMIYPYRGYAAGDKVYLNGRVLERERVIHSEETEDSFFNNLFRFYKRYESDEIPGVEITCEFEGQKYINRTNEEGFYNFEIPYKNPEGEFWKKAKFSITDKPDAFEQEHVTAEGQIMFPNPDSKFGIISDVDDTILESHITNFWLKIKTLAFNHANNRVAFPGVAELYRGLVSEKEGAYTNPIWFVSGSSWNLYDLLDRFCRDKKIPHGPFLLRELSISAKKFIKHDSQTYKLGQIRPLLEKTDPLPFIFIGDSGQKDPEIYEQIAEEFPGRVLAIYIRDVTPEKRDDQIRKIAKNLEKKDITMILANDSAEAAKHARENGWINQEHLDNVNSAVDEQ